MYIIRKIEVNDYNKKYVDLLSQLSIVDSKDDITFEEADARDERLGLKELAESLKKTYTIINN